MSLIILISQGTGIFQGSSFSPENEIFNVIYFNTDDISVFTQQVVGGSEFFLPVDFLLYVDPVTGDEYYHDGLGGFYVVSGQGPAPVPTYTFQLLRNPPSGGTAHIISSPGPYPEGAQVQVVALPADGWVFLGWWWGGEYISTDTTYTYTMRAADTTLIAFFQQASPPPPPGPEPDPVPQPTAFVADSYYPLEIRVANTQIPINNITALIDTGIFKPDLIGDFSYPITIPITEEVMVALGLPNDPQSSWNFANSLQAELWAHGNRRYRGHLDILDADEKAIKATFVFDSGFFIQQNKALSIRSCYSDSDTITLSQPTFAVGGYEIRFNFRNVRLTVNGSTRIFLRTQYADHITMLEAMADYLEGLPLNLDVSIQYSEDLTDESSRIITWDTNIVTTITLEPTTGTSRFTRARRLTSPRFVMGDYANVNESNRIAFPMIYNKELYEAVNPLHDGIVNRYDSQGRLHFGNISYTAFSEAFRWEHTLIPMIYLTDVVRAIFAKLNIAVSGTFFDNDLVKRMLLYNNRTLDFVQVTLNGQPSRRTALAIHAGDNTPTQEAYRYQNVHDFNIRLANHVPDVSVIDFLKALKNYFFLKYDFNILQNRVEIRFVRDIIDSPTILDFTKKSGRVYTLAHGKEKGLSITYENTDPIHQDGAGIKGEITPDYTVTNYLALDSLDAEIDQIAFVRSLRAYFRLTPDQDNPPFWKLYAFVMRDDTETQGERRAWGVGMVPLVDAYVDGRKMPAIEMTAEQPEVNLFNKDTGLRITAFYGEQRDAQSRPYHFASSTRFNAREVATTGQYDLDLRSDDMYPFWKGLDRILDGGKEYETNLLLNDVDLIDLSTTSRIRIANIDYLIDEMQILNTQGEYSIAKVKMWKVKS